MRTFVYVDGFNLYYGALKGTPHKWLDIKALVGKLLIPGHEIVKIKYFTARVSGTPGNPNCAARQDAYIRALVATCGVEVYYGHFSTHTKKCRRADGKGFIEVFQTDEKGSDVNLATHLVSDAHKRSFDAAIVVTNDSDLCEPVRIVAQEMRRKVGVLMPLATPGRQPSIALRKVATFTKPIRVGACQSSQLPEIVTVDGQEVHRPAEWR